METELFRSEVAHARRGQWLGPVYIGLPPMTRVLSLLGALVALAIVLFLMLGSYTRRERVGGELLPSGGLLAVTALGNGVLTRVLVVEGQAVSEGEPLLEISTEINGATIGAVGAAIGGELQRQRRRLQQDLTDQQTTNPQRRAAAAEGVEMLREQLRVVAAQRAIREQQAGSAKNLLERLRPLAEKGLVGVFEFKRQEAQSLEAEAQVRVIALQRLDVERQLNTALEQLRQIPLNEAQGRHDSERQLGDIEQALARNDAQRALVVRAARAGIVSGVTVNAGQAVATGQRLLALIPADSTLQAELWVPSRAIGFVAAGDRVVLRYHAYPYEKFGQQWGHVRGIARSALSAGEASRLLGQTIATPVYRVTVDLEQQALTIFGKSLPLRPNMELDADILLERRRLFEWLFLPFQSLGARSPVDASQPLSCAAACLGFA
ncbi:MAG: HlyD family efflux transporter periplasmic adaptor subunit [Dokdonella sp.]